MAVSGRIMSIEEIVNERHSSVNISVRTWGTEVPSKEKKPMAENKACDTVSIKCSPASENEGWRNDDQDDHGRIDICQLCRIMSFLNGKHGWLTEEERKGYIARNTVGRMEPGSVHYMGSPLKFYWVKGFNADRCHILMTDGENVLPVDTHLIEPCSATVDSKWMMIGEMVMSDDSTIYLKARVAACMDLLDFASFKNALEMQRNFLSQNCDNPSSVK